MEQPSERSAQAESNPLLFIKEVAKYFMDFLETDFHKQRAPKRAIRFRDANGLLVGINLKKYSSFVPKIWYLTSRGFARSLVNEIGRGSYRTEVPRSLVELIRLQTERISDDELATVISAIVDKISKAAVSHSKDYEKALTVVTEGATRAIQKEVVIPLISNLEKPLQNLELGDGNQVYLMQEELTGVLNELLSNKISEVLRLTFGKQQVDAVGELHSVFELSEVKTRVLAFFESLKVGDLFQELFEIERNRKILDKQELYLYFCDILYDNGKYPIFYIPFSLALRDNVLLMEFDSQVYINKRALEYVVQEVNEKEGRRGTLRCCSERIIYLAEHETDFSSVLSAALQELTNVLQLDRTIDVGNPGSQVVKSQLVRMSNTCYFALFDKADEALVNDYEEILRLLALGEDNPLAVAFRKLIDDFIHREPKPFTLEVEDEWDDSSPSERLVFNSPIPLNSEQRQILSALNKDGCRYVTVEGPPGTGKSHTITAVVFDAIQKDQSVLVLSDKKEALDVVEDKITDTMNRVRFDKHFQNPILRLGRTGSTYSEILSTSSIDNIKTHFRAVKKEYDSVSETITKTSNALKEDIEAEIVSYGEVNTAEIRELIELENLHTQAKLPVELSEFLDSEDGALHLEELRNVSVRLLEILKSSGTPSPEMGRVLKILGQRGSHPLSETSADELLERASKSSVSLNTVLTRLSDKSVKAVGLFGTFSKSQLPFLGNIIREYDACRGGFFGPLFKGRRIQENDRSAQTLLSLTSAERPYKLLPDLRDGLNTFTAMATLIGDDGGVGGSNSFDVFSAVHQFLIHPECRPFLDTLVAVRDECEYLRKNVLPRYPKSMQIAGISGDSVLSLVDNWIAKMGQVECDGLIRHLSLHQKLHKAFSEIPLVNYGQQQSSIEDLVTVQMTHLLDGRVIEFYEYNRSTAKTLRAIIRSKRRFPRDEFGKLRKAFPCILAGIRDYAEYIPLETEIFDLLIIDEASQVSVAQAFPALLRSKKVLILGDRKQFSNVKAAQARSDTNREYVNQLREVFVHNVSDEQAKLVRLEKFNIKASILDFFELITNYQVQLSKYFRGYKEIISFSNHEFYKDSLQVMKIRGKPVDEVLKFTYLPHDGKLESFSKTNPAEVEFIASELRKLKEQDSSVSVGIITPHTNQQKLLIETINKMPERDFFFNDLKLKIMTFDTCQGEERDLVFYSMVATPADDRLWGVFIKDLQNIQVEEEGQIKAQRLNVGLSRAKECMHFVVSKPLDNFTGSIGLALRHYKTVLSDARQERSVAEVDKTSPMEAAMLNWFYQTQFWEQNKSRVEIIPQFEIGKYLKQLDKTYEHPKYRVDFLLIVRGEGRSEQKVIMEYDGFLEHFRELPGINETNYADYYSPEDVYRQKVLEGYGYRFLRINRFNVGKKPVQTLNQRLLDLLATEKKHNSAIDSIRNGFEGLQNGELKECPKCKELRAISDFENESLASGRSRFCAACRTKPVPHAKPIKKVPFPNTASEVGKKCPKCGSRMHLRTGRYGKFYGCSKYPYCKGTMKA
jgi:superfamily I DNA and/or RNA helicase